MMQFDGVVSMAKRDGTLSTYIPHSLFALPYASCIRDESLFSNREIMLDNITHNLNFLNLSAE